MIAILAWQALFSIGLVQMDNLLPAATHPVVLQIPQRQAYDSSRGGGALGGGSRLPASGTGGRARRPTGAWCGDGADGNSAAAGASAGEQQPAACTLCVRRRASGQLQDVLVELRPMDLSLEASFLVRLGQLLAGGGARPKDQGRRADWD